MSQHHPKTALSVLRLHIPRFTFNIRNESTATFQIRQVNFKKDANLSHTIPGTFRFIHCLMLETTILG